MIIRIVLVPAGAEYSAVKRGLRRVQNRPRVVAIPAGPSGLRDFLKTWQEQSPTEDGGEDAGILLMGLGGSLCAHYGVGDSVVVSQVWNGFEDSQETFLQCDPKLSKFLATQLEVEKGIGVTCDRVITQVEEKKKLCDRYNAQVVDMESFTLLQALRNYQSRHRVAILRIISDSCHHNLPDISKAIGPDGSLNIMVILLNFSKQPVAALRLIQGSLKGLKALETLAHRLFSEPISEPTASD
ncbi:MAG: hypothetical protein AAGC93_11700 [Cyanobacteria bacterium P01_F01_bin.53]